jgi:hypothetical protein
MPLRPPQLPVPKSTRHRLLQLLLPLGSWLAGAGWSLLVLAATPPLRLCAHRLQVRILQREMLLLRG